MLYECYGVVWSFPAYGSPVLGAVARLALLATVSPKTRSSFTLLVLEIALVLHFDTLDILPKAAREFFFPALLLLTCFPFPPSSA